MVPLYTTLICCSIFLVVASFIHLLRIDYWWVRIWDFPQLQLFVLTLICLGIWFILREIITWPLALVPAGLLAAAAYQIWLIFPYTALHRWQMKPAKKADLIRTDTHQFRLLTANVYMENTHTQGLLALIEENEPDVVLLLETNTFWHDAMKPLSESYPHQIAYPLENTYGMLMYSRLPMREGQIRFLIENDIPSIRVQLQLASGFSSTAFILCRPAQLNITVLPNAMLSYC